MVFRKIIEFSYDNQSYVLYLDKNNNKFYLKKDNLGKLRYLDLDELIKLNNVFSNIPNVMNIKNGKVKFIPKIMIGSVAVSLSLVSILTFYSLNESNKRLDEYKNNYKSDESVVVESPVVDSNEDTQLEVDTYEESDWLHYKFIYDMDYLDMILDYSNDDINLSDFINLIDKNSNINKRFKDLLKEYCTSLYEKYPNADKRILYENLKSLEIVECTKQELIGHSLSVDSYGCYVKTENKIYVLKDSDYAKGTWDYQVIFHEISHCLRTRYCYDNDEKIRVQYEGFNYDSTIISEAMNSLFAVSLFDYEENDIAYQLQSNYLRVMIDCMDNFSLEDYVNHSLSYFVKKLDEFNKDDNYAVSLLNLIEFQYDDYHDDSISTTQESYYPIYDYISNMYFNKYISSDMSYDEMLSVTNDLINKILFDVPQEYNIDKDYFYKCLDNYCQENDVIKQR